MASSKAQPRWESEPFGALPDGREVRRYTLVNSRGLTARVINLGGILTELHVPDRTGQLADVVLGFDRLAPYVADHPHFGAITGRVANRIAHGRFTLDGRDYQLARNNGPHHLHGGPTGFGVFGFKVPDLFADDLLAVSRREQVNIQRIDGQLALRQFELVRNLSRPNDNPEQRCASARPWETLSLRVGAPALESPSTVRM